MTPFDKLKRRFPQLIPIPELRASVSIIQLALHYGYQYQPAKGKARPVFTHPHYQDTIIIKHPNQPSQQLYQRAGDFTDAGTIIDFVRCRLTTVFARFNRPNQHQLTSVTQVLYDYLQVDPGMSTAQLPSTPSADKPNSITPFRLADFDIRPIESTNYLLDRAIKPATWQTPEFAGKVWTQVAYYDQQVKSVVSFTTAQAQPSQAYRTFHNVAFPYYNSSSNEVSGLEIRNHGLKQHASGSDRSTSVFVSNSPAKAARFYVMESVIDALSHCQMKRQQGNHSFEDVYFSTGGQLTPGQFDTILSIINLSDKITNWQLCLSFDNDLSGHNYDLQFIKRLIKTQLPLTSILVNKQYILYQLPQKEQYQSFREIITEQISFYNKRVSKSTMVTEQSNQSTLPAPLIVVDQSNKDWQLSLPFDGSAMSFFSRLLLNVTGFDKRISINKSLDIDFNQELSRK